MIWRARGREHRERGATLVEYAMGVALVGVVSLGAMQFMEDGASDEFNDRADRAGAPDLIEPTDGGTTDGGSATAGGTDGPPPDAEEAQFEGFSGIRSTGNNPWTANVRVDVNDSNGDNLSGVTVTGTWSYFDGSTTVSFDVTCTQTNGSGSCPFQLGQIPNNALPTSGATSPGVTFTMTNISGGVPPVTYTGGTQTVVVPK
jgi:Flp pilus assembly pilin Flp